MGTLALPGSELIERGLQELALGEETEAALLVLIGAPRLRRLGVDVPRLSVLAEKTPELRLYERLAASDPDSAHSRYNALLRRLVSFERALACVS
ncbi:MAG: hypothetical protein GEV06_16270 [Luteitalea sp.]|nr:hypothetical protein [Luteitalea sp.]